MKEEHTKESTHNSQGKHAHGKHTTVDSSALYSSEYLVQLQQILESGSIKLSSGDQSFVFSASDLAGKDPESKVQSSHVIVQPIAAQASSGQQTQNIACNVCKQTFGTAQQFRSHMKTPEHLANMRARVDESDDDSDDEGKNDIVQNAQSFLSHMPVKDEIVSDTDGEEEQQADEEEEIAYLDPQFHTSAYLDLESITQPSLPPLRIAKRLLLKDKVRFPFLKTSALTTVTKGFASLAESTGRIACFLSSGGKFASCIVQEGKVQEHRAFQSYTVRKKQGGSQTAHDKSGGKAQSVGAMIRRQQALRYQEKIEDLLFEWRHQLQSCDRIILYAPGFDRYYFYMDGLEKQKWKTTGGTIVNTNSLCIANDVDQKEVEYMKKTVHPTLDVCTRPQTYTFKFHSTDERIVGPISAVRGMTYVEAVACVEEMTRYKEVEKVHHKHQNLVKPEEVENNTNNPNNEDSIHDETTDNEEEAPLSILKQVLLLGFYDWKEVANSKTSVNFSQDARKQAHALYKRGCWDLLPFLATHTDAVLEQTQWRSRFLKKHVHNYPNSSISQYHKTYAEHFQCIPSTITTPAGFLLYTVACHESATSAMDGMKKDTSIILPQLYKIMSSHLDIHEVDSKHRNILHNAILENLPIHFITCLLELQVSVDQKDEFHKVPFDYLQPSKKGKSQILQELWNYADTHPDVCDWTSLPDIPVESSKKGNVNYAEASRLQIEAQHLKEKERKEQSERDRLKWKADKEQREAEQAQRQVEKDKQDKQNAFEIANKRASDKSLMMAEKEQKDREKAMTDSEKRARAFDIRQSKAKCAWCKGTQSVVPYERMGIEYCTAICMRKHRDVLGQ